MATSKEITNLVINKVESQEVYDYMAENNLINDDELYLVQSGSEEFELTIDSELSSTSENPVQNKTIKAKFDSIEENYASKEYVDASTVQPDWNQNDETAPDYIKNKPFVNPTTADNGKFLRVVNGAPAWAAVQNAEEVEW